MLPVYGDVAELVDALDSKSCGLRPCQFESDHPYQRRSSDFVRAFCLFDIKIGRIN